MKSQRLIQIGGIVNLLFVAFHILSAWQAGQVPLLADYRPVLQVLNIHLAYGLAIFFVASLLFTNEMCTTKPGRTFSLLIAGFWILRAVSQAAFWGVSFAGSWMILLVCLGIASLYLIPVVKKPSPNN